MQLARVRIVRELGARTPGTYLGRRDEDQLTDVVLETFANLDPKSTRSVLETANRLKGARPHPHIVSVIACDRIGNGISIVTDFVDGMPLEEVFFAMSLGARLRAVVDVLAALSALHQGDMLHGGILLRSSFAEKTGKTKLGFAYRRALCVKKESYAPEMLLGDEGAIDARTDVYNAGVLLWEAVNGRPLFGSATPEDVVREQLAGRIAKPHVPLRDKWASTVVPVVERALSIEPSKRYASIAEMAAALRIAVRARLMTHEDVIEELWPAETKPKHSSGVIPAVRPVVEAKKPEPIFEPIFELGPMLDQQTPELTMDPEPLPEGTSSGIVQVASAPQAIMSSGVTVAAPVLSSPPKSRVPFVAAIVVVISAVIAIGATLVHLTRTQAQGPRAIVTEEPPRMPAPPPPPKTAEESVPPPSTAAPIQTAAPAPDATPRGGKQSPGRRTAKPRGNYDPESI
ncbi:MAG TPA: protein kinase [Polyangiaceae bacterium]|nr:protein kinase [Polyangiaceae bacterium]